MSHVYHAHSKPQTFVDPARCSGHNGAVHNLGINVANHSLRSIPMAEGLGVASSVIAVVDLSAKVFSLCLQYSREVKNAKEDIERLSAEVVAFQDTTKKLQTLVEGPRGQELSASQQLRSTIEDSLLRLEKLGQQLQTPTHRKIMSKFGARALKWPFKRKDVDDVIQDFARCRENISLALNIDQT